MFICSRFPRNHDLVWWVRVSLGVRDRVSKLLGSGMTAPLRESGILGMMGLR